MSEFLTYIFKPDMKKLFMDPTDNAVIQFFRYIFVGGIAFLADEGSLFLIELMGVHYLIAAVFAFVLGLAVNFIMSKLLVFNGSKSNRSNETEFIVYAVIGGIGLGITEVILFIFTEKLNLYFMVSKIIAAAIVLVWNFMARKTILYSE